MEKIYLLDTTVLVDHLRDIKSATEFLLNTSRTISIVSVAELIQGADNKIKLRNVRRLVNSLEVLPIIPSASQKAVDLMESFYLSYHLKFLDALIAATAIEEDLTLITSNTKHFSFIKPLKLQDWKKV